MIVSFYDAGFKGLQNNASLVVDNASYKLVKRGVEFDSMSCKCEAFTGDAQPTYCVVKDDRGRYVYGCLAGVPQLNNDNQTEIQASDLKLMLDCDVALDTSQTFFSLFDYLRAVFDTWKEYTLQYDVELVCPEENVSWVYLKPPEGGYVCYNVWHDLIAPYLKFYGLYMTSKIDLVNKKVVFTVGKSMITPKAVRLWEYGIKNFGKVTTGVSEAQCIVYDKTGGTLVYGYHWVLGQNNTVTVAHIDAFDYLPTIYPIRRKIVWKETENYEEEGTSLLNEGNREALEILTKYMFNENIELSNFEADFSTRFDIYLSRGGNKYKSLPCGELHYDANGLVKVQIGYRFTGIEFLLR
ncbi:MAG: hypothetical protein IJX91_04630 [Clostridia bacterium]|nr:hypothetical protein [Clostridia bacterium]